MGTRARLGRVTTWLLSEPVLLFVLHEHTDSKTADLITIERKLCAVSFVTSDPFSVVLDDVIPLHVRVESEPVFLYEPYLLFNEHFELVVSSVQTHSLLFFAVTDVQYRYLLLSTVVSVFTQRSVNRVPGRA